MTSGVPQGSVLEPTLFINDLPGCLENTSKLYADDGKVFAENQKSNLQNDIHNTANWCDVWSMALNFKKFQNGQNYLLRYYMQNNFLKLLYNIKT